MLLQYRYIYTLYITMTNIKLNNIHCLHYKFMIYNMSITYTTVRNLSYNSGVDSKYVKIIESYNVLEKNTAYEIMEICWS